MARRRSRRPRSRICGWRGTSASFETVQSGGASPCTWQPWTRKRCARYITRPPLSSLRLSLTEQGKVVHELRAPFKDGTTHFVFDPLVFIERLAALVPPPRMHQLTYHAVLSSAASRRSEIVPGSQPPTAPESAGPSSSPPRPPRPCNRYSWPELMARVFAVDVLRCGKCRSRLRWIAAITEASVIARILAHLGQESTSPVPMPARPPPQPQLPY